MRLTNLAFALLAMPCGADVFYYGEHYDGRLELDAANRHQVRERPTVVLMPTRRTDI